MYSYHSSKCLWSPFHSWDIAEFSGAHFLIRGQDWHPLQSAGKVETLVDFESLGFDASWEHLFIWSKRWQATRQGGAYLSRRAKVIICIAICKCFPVLDDRVKLDQHGWSESLKCKSETHYAKCRRLHHLEVVVMYLWWESSQQQSAWPSPRDLRPAVHHPEWPASDR